MKDRKFLATQLEKKINLLLVDDDRYLLRSLSDLFSSPAFNVVSVLTLEQARAAQSQVKGGWHCWVLDIDLGMGKSGLELIKENPGYPFVLVLSGLRSMNAATHALASGALKAFDKDPQSLDVLFAEVCEVAALGFILRGKQTKNLPVFMLLRVPSVRTVNDWAEKAHITMRQLARICEGHQGIHARQFIALYNTCRHLLGIGGSSDKSRAGSSYVSFLEECLEYTSSNGEVLQRLLQ
jgi:ActR/RegA family two-component response regulator